MGRFRRSHSVRKSRNTSLISQERAYAKAPHSFVFARPGVGSVVRQLSMDLRRIFEPYTATRLQVSKKNVLKDFINIAGPLNVTHLMYLTHPRPDKLSAKRARHEENKRRRAISGNMDGKEVNDNKADEDNNHSSLQGGVYLHLIRTPSGPSITFRVTEYSLIKDVFSLVRRVVDARQFSTPPLLVMTGFGGSAPQSADTPRQPPPPHLRLLVDMFQNMLPSLNIQKLKLSGVRRVLLLSREVDGASGEETIFLRHFHIRIENRSVSKALRRLGVGGSFMRKSKSGDGGLGPGGTGRSSGVPSLGKYVSMDDYLTKTSLLTDSGLSDVEDIAEVELPGGPSSEVSTVEATTTIGGKPGIKKRKQTIADAKDNHGFVHLATCRKASICLTEIGPRMSLKLIKIEEGLNSGCVLYHSWNVKTVNELINQEQERIRKRDEKTARKVAQEKRRLANEAAKASHREACLDGMRKAGQLPTVHEKEPTGTNEHNGEALSKEEASSSGIDRMIHQVSDDEVNESEHDSDKEAAEAVRSKLRNASSPFRRVTKKRKTFLVAKKHPAYKYLREKSERDRLKKKK